MRSERSEKARRQEGFTHAPLAEIQEARARLLGTRKAKTEEKEFARLREEMDSSRPLGEQGITKAERKAALKRLEALRGDGIIIGGCYECLRAELMEKKGGMKKKRSVSNWNQFAAKVRKDNPHLSFKEAMKLASKQYKAKGAKGKAKPKRAAPKKAAPKKAVARKAKAKAGAKAMLTKDELKRLLKGL